MKGIVFNELIEMVEEKFGFEISNQMLQSDDSTISGIYSGVGTYPFEELLAIVVNLHKLTGIEIPELLNTYGKHLAHTFYKNYNDFFKRHDELFSFLSSIESIIHVEVLKLYNDASLPKFDYENDEEKNQMTMIYSSERKLYSLAEGLIMGCADIYNKEIDLQTELIKEDGSEVRFTITKK